MFEIKDYAIATMAVMIIGGYFGYESSLDSLESKYDKKNTDYLTCKLNKVTLLASVDKQNIQIKKNSIELSGAIKALEDWKNKPKEIRYITIYEILKDNNITKGDCNEINSAIKSISFDEL